MVFLQTQRPQSGSLPSPILFFSSLILLLVFPLFPLAAGAYMLDTTRSCLWLWLLVLGLLLFTTNGAYVPITYVQSAVAKGAVCLDGSPPAYHWDKGYGTGINSWLIQLEGGGWCNNVSSCLVRKNTHLGSSKRMVKQIPFSGILNNKRSKSGIVMDHRSPAMLQKSIDPGSGMPPPYRGLNMVTNLHFRGASVWLAVMEDLLSKGMRNAENAILSGCSAGGLASILHCDSFRALLPMGTKVKCISDAGYFINTRDVSGGHYIQTFFDQLVATHGSAKNLLPSCTSRMKPGLVSAFCFLTSFTLHCNFQYSDQYSIHISQCFFPQYIAQQIRTPLFIINAAYDSWQIRNILAPGIADPHGHWESCKLDIKNCLPSQIKVMQGD
ncbi:hypothetical protein GOBAR_DD13236 [Gossypium barbadense]|nr:hypothetical protein GOBAR_DD13236 [Gossypium barbadense]